jgi:hypothetical protein
MVEQRLPQAAVDRLRSALDASDYTVDGVAALLGAGAHAALSRNETTPALRRTTDGSTLATLVRLWPLQAPLERARVDAALPGLVPDLIEAGILTASGDRVRARLDIRPYADETHDWWVASDLTPGLDGAARRMSPQHVLGVSSASASLAQLTMRTPVGRALDLGTGSGVQALHLGTHADAVVATDVNQRCLLLADLTFRLNGATVDLREGSLWDPVADERFDLVVSNPPFVISPGVGERLVYRDSGRPGDQVMYDVVTGVVPHLTPGGSCQVLGNWVHRRDEPWEDRLATWIRSTGCDAWVVERELIDVNRYVELWLDDAGLRGSQGYASRYDSWLGWFEQQGIDAVGFGWLLLRNVGRDVPHVQIESWPYEVEQPLGPHLAAWGQAMDVARAMDDAALLGSRLLVAPDVVEERFGPPGGADPERIVLRQQHGLRRARQVSTAVAAMVGACDGELTVAQIADALGTLLKEPVHGLRIELVEAARGLLTEGLLLADG